MRSLLGGINQVWSQCGIEFLPARLANVSAGDLKVSYSPRSEGDLSAIAAALNPQGYGNTLPLTIAGAWNINNNGWIISGLGWAFVRPNHELDHIGAMVDAKSLQGPNAADLLAHELGHALSLQHATEESNVMIPEAHTLGKRFSVAQCEQARGFTQSVLQRFVQLNSDPDRVANR